MVEYLLTFPNKSNGKNPLQMTLDEAIKACLDAQALTSRSAKLSDVIKDYRNLIHPGRVIRLKEEYGRETAHIVLSLLSIIGAEIAAKRKQKYGLTAEQIVRKLTVDEGASALIPHLIAESSSIEQQRLVRDVIWKAYKAECAPGWSNPKTLTMLTTCYRKALKSLPLEEQKSAAKRFAQMVRQESSEELAEYGDALFSCEEIGLLDPGDALLVKQHIFSRMEGNLVGKHALPFGGTIQDLGPYLDEDDIPKFVRICLRFALSNDTQLQQDYRIVLTVSHYSLQNDELKKQFIDVLEQGKKGMVLTNHQDKQQLIEEIIENCNSDIPF